MIVKWSYGQGCVSTSESNGDKIDFSDHNTVFELYPS